ncbi:hypothetical protein NP493_1099g00044 [Ridgeia piscesae]|uniref:Uncharacterized protein n=1 Tax=Ridgeia piscesae TaxID=27915 RepID=A0AAD9KHB4_RIDPI|nr:hypothetical protein NP493_1099g00044 [Ridgeia piscesae]
MSMPGSETHLEELMSRVLGDLIQEGCVAKIADHLHVGGNPPDEVFHNWIRVLVALRHTNLRLSGAYKVLSRVLPAMPIYLIHLIKLLPAEHRTKSDVLWIVTDGSIKNRGIAATLYVRKSDKLLLAGFFNAKLRKHQVTWLPCDVEVAYLYLPIVQAIGAETKLWADKNRRRFSTSPLALTGCLDDERLWGGGLNIVCRRVAINTAYRVLRLVA